MAKTLEMIVARHPLLKKVIDVDWDFIFIVVLPMAVIAVCVAVISIL